MPRKLTTEQFIEKAKSVHSDKYDYSKVEYFGAHKKICIVCPTHGEFWQTPNSHVLGHGCPKCICLNANLTTEEFIEKARQVHGNKYDYSKTIYNGMKKKMIYMCPKHGEIEQQACDHLRGNGCYKCNGTKGFTTDEFIQRAKEIHGDKYDYSKVNYVDTNTKVCIICPTHGEFWQTPNSHINSKHGCQQCSHRSYKYSLIEFIQRAKEIHGDKYDYSKVEYKNSHTKVCIICPIHGEFWQTPNGHLMGLGCNLCGYITSGSKISLNTEKFIARAKMIHGDKYDYSKVDYLNINSKVCITCPKHGDFWQVANYHLSGNGCPQCNQSHLEEEISVLLENNNINNYKYNKLYDWLNNLQLDFYIPEFNIAIECQGMQHFRPIERWGGRDSFEKLLQRDAEKRKLCEEYGVKLLYYSNLHIDYPYKVYEDKDELLKEILGSSETS